MLVVIMLTMFSQVLSDKLSPSLTDWTLITSSHETFNLPIKEHIFQMKSFLPKDYDTNPVYNETIKVDKSTTMMLVLYDGHNYVGRLTWNSIHYERGYDVWIQECNMFYVSFKSFPCGGRKEQLWAWKFNQRNVELTCDGEVQYSQAFDEGDDWSDLKKKCRKFGRAKVDRVAVKFMKDFYIRAIPIEANLIKPISTEATSTTTAATTARTTTPTTSSPLPGPIGFGKDYPTCDCWTAECKYCSSLECTVKQDLPNSQYGISVRSKVSWGSKKLNSILLYDEKGENIGSFRWGLSAIHLTGCIRCQTPGILRRARALIGLTSWVFSLTGGVVQIKIRGEVLFQHKLKGECAKVYGKVKRFAFFGMTCENRFRLQPDMEVGGRITPNCADSCDQSSYWT